MPYDAEDLNRKLKLTEDTCMRVLVQAKKEAFLDGFIIGAMFICGLWLLGVFFFAIR